MPLGLISARWPGRASDHTIRAGSILGVSMPIFWLALILQLVLSDRLHLLPALVVAAYPAGLLTRMIRAQVLDTIGDTHVQMVRALGFTERAVYGRFAMKLAWNPVAATLALVFAYSLVNTFLVEAIFDWPGLGEYAAASIQTLDTPAILGVTLFIALVYEAANLVVDIVQAAIDPRIRLR